MFSLNKLKLSTSSLVGFRKSIFILSGRNYRATSEYDKIGFIGTGNMAKAIIQGLVSEQKFSPEQIYATDKDEKYLNYLENEVPFFQEYKINFISPTDIFKETNALMLCVKPQDMKTLLENNSANITKEHLLISIAAGTQLNKIEECLSTPTPVMRIMTNTAALIKQGCSVYSKGKYATSDDAEFVSNLLKSIGTSEGEIDESLMDVVTALSGSGPAYMFLILESLANGAEKMGMDKDMAVRLASQTMLGAASMVMDELNNKKSGKKIMQMKEEVCSPGGTTVTGIAQLEKGKVPSALIDCIEHATKRAVQLNIK